MEYYSCSCKGIRTCNLCQGYKINIIDNKQNNKIEIKTLNQFISVKEYNMKINDLESSIDKELNKEFFSKIKFSEFFIEYNSTYESILNKANKVSKEPNEALYNEDYDNLNLISVLLNSINKEIIHESYKNEFYKYMNLSKLNTNEIPLNTEIKHLFNGLFIIKNLFTEIEQDLLVMEINKYKWNESQSGRKKQDYGPKINYKKKKLRIDEMNLEISINKNIDILIENKLNKENHNMNNLIYNSVKEEKLDKYKKFQFPYFSTEKCCFYTIIEKKLRNLNFFDNFKIAEIGNLLYEKNKGAHIEPHIDDCWIWGNRIIGINLLSDTKMTFSRVCENINSNKNDILSCSDISFEIDLEIKKGDIYIMSDYSRYLWKHSIKQKNINEDRIVITLREFEETFLSDYLIEQL